MEAIVTARPEDMEDWLRMGADLWPEHTEEELEEAFSNALSSDRSTILFYRVSDKPVAFLYMSIRVDYVQGAGIGPTGYVEGIYVKPPCRRTGVAQRLLAQGEEWVREKGCIQIGSDIYLDNQLSHKFHTANGFKEAGRLITFIKNL